MQGDITQIYDASGTLQAEYVYDAWGNHKVLSPNGTENVDPNFIGNINPFRYRGYYFDMETGLYYLQSRYYDPETGRFINMDDISYLDPNTINGLNLYSYCANNPVMFTDSTGQSIWEDIGNWFRGVWNGFTNSLFWNAITHPLDTINSIFADPLGSLWNMTYSNLHFMIPQLYWFDMYNAYDSDGAYGLGSYMGGVWGDAAIMAATYVAFESVKFLATNKILNIGRIDGITYKGRINGYLGIRYQNNFTHIINSIEIHPAHSTHGIHIQKNTWWINKAGFQGEYFRAFGKHLEIFKFWKGWF
ncbi:MAG: RHS repeat-associated core domain-containing protein [Clostridia bacterium]